MPLITWVGIGVSVVVVIVGHLLMRYLDRGEY